MKKNSTFTIDEQLKHEFKTECVKNSVDMSETVESLMENYIKASNTIRAEQAKLKTNE